MMTFPSNLTQRWDLEGRLFACISTLDLISRTYERGELEPNVVHKQFKSLITTIVEVRASLEPFQFDLDAFIQKERIDQLYPFGLEKLHRTEGTDEKAQNRIDYRRIKQLPSQVAEFVSHAIELLDLLRLEAIATVDRILPYLDELYAILLDSAIYGEDHWVTRDIAEWIAWMDKQKAGVLLKKEELEKLELQAARWLSDFRRELKNL
jgi:hypothetical protein